ncbi:MAG TPA: PEGA domain-containing protein, partial [Thermotogota bacterium]|nr:PEGA domain-containing protein [Thermotogota bacterium]
QEQHLHVTLPKRTQRVQIRTNVEGATIYIDGEPKGEAPQTQDFAWGSTHEIQAIAEGYHDTQQTWQWGSKDLQRGEQIQLQLEKRPVTLMIQSEPQEANLQVDGEEKANGSVQLQVEWGKVLNLQASAPGYEPLEQSYTPEKSPERQSITLKLQKRTTVIHLQSEPEGARIEVDGKNVGSAPVTVNLEEGTHEIQATKSGYLEAKKSIVVTIETGTSKDLGRERVEKLVLQKAPGKVNITTSPSGASIYINGSYKGTSSYTYEGEEGNIQVEVRKSGYHSKSETFRVEAGKTTSERISLEQVTGKVLITPQQTGLLVLSVGVSNYQSSQVNDLLSPADDARDFASLMQKKYNVPSSNVRLLVDSQASKAGIVAGLNWLVSQANSSKDVLIFFSGHGGQLKDENGDEDDGMDELLCPYDFSMQDKVNTALLDDEIAVFIQTLTSKANSVTFIFDSCFGGESGSKAMDINVSSNFAFL